MKYLTFIISTLILLSPLYGQKDFKPPKYRKVIISMGDSTIEARVWLKKDVNPKLKKEYYWYDANTIKKNQGGYNGQLLHGKYRVFGFKKNMLTSGTFKKGLKHKTWKHWYKNGKLKSIYNWKKGEKKGRYMLFDPQGTLVREGSYKNDLLHGKTNVYRSDTVYKEIKYKKGKVDSSGGFWFFGNNKDETEEEDSKKSNKKKWWQLWKKEKLKQEDSKSTQPEQSKPPKEKDNNQWWKFWDKEKKNKETVHNSDQ